MPAPSFLKRRRRALRAALAVLVLAGVTAAIAPVGPAAARPRRADLSIARMTADPAEVIVGDSVFLSIEVANLGTATSDSVTVLVTLPPTLESRSFNAPRARHGVDRRGRRQPGRAA